jgi:hypothetical protein
MFDADIGEVIRKATKTAQEAVEEASPEAEAATADAAG